MTHIVPLGTASAIPTRDRHLSAAALEREGRTLLFDCGEGTQLQLLRAGLKRSRIDGIFITHFHGDHFYGLMGMLSTMALLKREEKLVVVGPERIEEIVRSLPGLANDWLPFPVEYVELAEDFEHQVVLETDEYTVEARPVEHRIFTAGFRYSEKPKPGHLDVEKARALGATDFKLYPLLKAGQAVTLGDGQTIQPEDVVGPEQPGATFAYVLDTRPCEGGHRLAEGADVLFHEATFTSELQQRALDTGHSTAREAAEVACRAGVGRLLLSHFSARYPDVQPIVDEARAYFQNTEAAEELERYALEPAAAGSGVNG